MPTQTLTQCQGLVTGPNSEQAGPGALKQALNVVVKRPHLIEKRRPVRQYTQTGSFTTSATPNAIFGYNNRLYIIDNAQRWYVDDGNNTATLTDLSVTGFGSVAFGQYSTAEMNANAYLPFTSQVCKIDAIGSKPYKAGLQRPLTVTQCTAASFYGSNFPANTQAGYRLCFFMQDANNNLIISAPSQRCIANNNTGGTAGASLVFAIPSEILAAANPTSYGYQLYRTAIVSNTQDPGDEMGLVYQAFITAADIVATTVGVVDSLSDTVNKGPSLYSNQSQSGASQFNHQSPICTDIAAFKGAMFFANTTSKHRFSATLLGQPDTYAIQSITFAGGQSTYTFAASVVDQTIDNTMQLSVAGTTSGNNNNGLFPIVSITATTIVVTNAAGVAQPGIAGTAIVGKMVVGGRTYHANLSTSGTTGGFYGGGVGGSLAAEVSATASACAQGRLPNGISEVIALDGSSTVYGGAVAGSDDAPGSMLFEERSIGGSAFTVQAFPKVWSKKWSPTLTTAQSSNNDKAINRVYYSKYLQPEHVPLGSYFDIGGKTKKVLRIVPLRDSLFVFKEDGVFRITGDGSNWSVARFDDTIQLITPNALAVIYNTVYAITTKGIVAITDNGIRLLSEPISNLSRTYTDSPVSPTVYARASEKDGLVHFAITQGTSKLGLCYSYRTNTWTQDDLTSQGTGSVSLLNGPGVTVAGFNYLMNTDQVYVEPTVDPTENTGLGTILTGGPVPSDRYLINITNVNGGANQITATNNAPNVRSFTVGDLVFENNASIATAGLYVITNVNGNVLTLSAATASGAIAPSGTFAFTTGKAYIYGPLSVVVEYQPFTAGDDHTVKRFPAASVLLDSTSTANQAQIGFYTEIAKTEIDQTTTASNVFDLRALVPLTMNRAHRLSVVFRHAQPGQYVFIKGVSYDYTPYANTRSVE